MLALALVFIGFTQIHTFYPDLLSNPAVAIGYGSYVALGASVVLVMSWAVFPSKMRRAAPVATDPLGGYGAVNWFPHLGQFRRNGGGSGHVRSRGRRPDPVPTVEPCPSGGRAVPCS